ncbi:hypothetical protein TNIN_226751 [Trichonephila inaurata madagascariensis]|uniref:Uncharacterized protein n=1 Tax=Trichonephila inaurata madagascariensis TaxID=2747483 RepID=A0A8X6XZT8_9ARAC|nr:hypothetical protein TNIN_226751 [Trichonephila inaurata madagascariensis]
MAGNDGEIRMAGDDGENNMTGDETAGVNQDEVLFEMVNESTFKSLFNNEQDLCEQLPRTIHIMRSLKTEKLCLSTLMALKQPDLRNMALKNFFHHTRQGVK